MEILFKDGNNFYYLDNDELDFEIRSKFNINTSNTPHLDNTKVLYHYRDRRGKLFPVYYEYNGKYITKHSTGEYDILTIIPGDIKDYTSVNLKLL